MKVLLTLATTVAATELDKATVDSILGSPVFERVIAALDAAAGENKPAVTGEPVRNLVNVFNNHIPLPRADEDGDNFATIRTLRGSGWRGKDCDDTDATIHPGRSPTDGDADRDSNCNGISGLNPDSGVPYETELCGDPKDYRGVVVLGDSCAAHFTIDVDRLVLDLPAEGLMEFDSPQCSWSTGRGPRHTASTSVRCSHPGHRPANDTMHPVDVNGTVVSGRCPAAKLPLDSLYLRLKDRNRCNHRARAGDYQNIGVNGARSTSMCRASDTGECDFGIVNATARDADDVPALVFYAMVANDVCNGHGFGSMTKPDEFRQKVTGTLAYLDGKLPSGSHLVFIGLMDGRMMWDTMKDVKYPLLPLTYQQLWGITSLIGKNPCLGWLQPNATARNLTTAWAESLNDVLRDLTANNNSYANFDLTYLEYPLSEATVTDWEAQGGQGPDLFEAIGGGHPSTTSQILMAQAVWDELETNYPDVLGPVNPNNAQIEELFKDQGGY